MPFTHLGVTLSWWHVMHVLHMEFVFGEQFDVFVNFSPFVELVVHLSSSHHPMANSDVFILNLLSTLTQSTK